MDRLRITYPQYLVLTLPWENGQQSLGRIADRLDLESSTITPLAKRLEAAGLVHSRRNPAGERQLFVSLSDGGWDMRRRVSCLTQTLLERSGFGTEHREALNADIAAFRAALNRSWWLEELEAIPRAA